MSPAGVVSAGNGLSVSDNCTFAVDLQKYRQLYVAAGSGPQSSSSSAMSLGAPAPVAGLPVSAAGLPAVMAAAAAVKPPASIVTPNIHQPPPSLPPFLPPVQVRQLSVLSYLGTTVSAECRILIRADEFAHFCGISTFSRNFAKFCTAWRQIRHSLVWTGTICRRDFAMKYMTALTGGILKILS